MMRRTQLHKAITETNNIQWLAETQKLIHFYHTSPSAQIMNDIRDYLNQLQQTHFPRLIEVVIYFRQYVERNESKSLPRYQRHPLFLDAYQVQERNEYKALMQLLNSFLPQVTLRDHVKNGLFSLSNSIQMLANKSIKHPLETIASLLYLQTIFHLTTASFNNNHEMICDGSQLTDACPALMNRINAICTERALTPANIPLNITIGANNGTLLPASCVQPNKHAVCLDESARLEQHRLKPNKNNKLKDLRDRTARLYTIWNNQLDKKAYPILRQFPAQYQKTLTSILDEVKLFKSIYISKDYLNLYGVGNCGEQSYVAAAKLIQYNSKNNNNIKIQIIGLIDEKLSNSPISIDIIDHMFLLLNSNLPDVDLHDILAIQRYLSAIDEMTLICDPWNNGYSEFFQSDQTGLYKNKNYQENKYNKDFTFFPAYPERGKKDIQWTDLYVKTIHFNLAEIAELIKTPSAFQEMVCEELQKMDLDLAAFNCNARHDSTAVFTRSS